MNNEMVSVEWLKQNLNRKELLILDASPDVTAQGKSAQLPDFCIPNSRIFELKKKFVNRESPFPNTIPSPEQFEEECQKLGINSTSEIVVYDNLGIYTSPRVWWLFKVMGHKNVKVLNGGLGAWMKKGYQAVDRAKLSQDFAWGDFKSDFQSSYLLDYASVMDNISTKEFQLVDARSTGRFKGTAPEPRAYLQSGNIPNSVNIPYTKLLEDGKFKAKEALQEIFAKQLNDSKKLVFSCGSGITACIVLLASEIAFKKSRFLYDGSWTEYAERNNLKSEG